MSNKVKRDSPLVKSVLALDHYLTELERVGTKINSTDIASDFDLEYMPDLSGFPPLPPGGANAPTDTATVPIPDLAGAVQQQLGLRLVPGKAMLDVVADRCRRGGHRRLHPVVPL